MVNYHNHTILCGHASGEMDEYIAKAIENGMKEFGFSDHAPVPLHIREGISMSPEDVPGYISSILGMKEKHKNKIDVKLGFEIDFPFFSTFEREYLTNSDVDYIIGSVHYLGDWGVDNPDEVSRFEEMNIDDIYREYYSILERLAESGFCDIVGHFDLVKKFGHRAEADMMPVVRKIAKKISAKGITVEINTSGLRKPVHEIYPSDEIIKILFQENVPVTLGSDSHSPDDVCSGYPQAVEILKSAGYRKVSGFTKRKRHELLL